MQEDINNNQSKTRPQLIFEKFKNRILFLYFK